MTNAQQYLFCYSRPFNSLTKSRKTTKCISISSSPTLFVLTVIDQIAYHVLFHRLRIWMQSNQLVSTWIDTMSDIKLYSWRLYLMVCAGLCWPVLACLMCAVFHLLEFIVIDWICSVRHRHIEMSAHAYATQHAAKSKVQLHFFVSIHYDNKNTRKSTL